MLPRKAALNLCAAAAVLAFALGARGDNAGFAANNQEVPPPPPNLI